MTLEKYLKDHIQTHGPIDIGQFMNIALGHPEHGYYMKKDPFGRGGDFTTAPEISQMFGEVIGAWVADVWMQMGSPPAFTLLECGPGRGTLMADILRATEKVKGFRQACHVHFLETSPALKDLQKKNIPDAEWHETLGTVPSRRPMIAIGNEFLDALPVRQMQKTKDGWMERAVAHDGDRFIFALIKPSFPFAAEGQEGDILEVAPARITFVRYLCRLLMKTGGVALFLDYGHTKAGSGDTLQAVYKHHYCPVLEHIGDADLTAHVDFESVREEAKRNDMKIYGPVEQGVFLKGLGIEQRAAYLSGKAPDKADIEIALKRLTNSDQMGSLFKVIGISHGLPLRDTGF